MFAFNSLCEILINGKIAFSTKDMGLDVCSVEEFEELLIEGGWGLEETERHRAFKRSQA